MRRINPLALRLGLTTSWRSAAKSLNSIYLTRVFNHFDFFAHSKVNNLQVSNLKRLRRFFWKKNFKSRRLITYFFGARSSVHYRRNQAKIKKNVFFFYCQLNFFIAYFLSLRGAKTGLSSKKVKKHALPMYYRKLILLKPWTQFSDFQRSLKAKQMDHDPQEEKILSNSNSWVLKQLKLPEASAKLKFIALRQHTKKLQSKKKLASTLRRPKTIVKSSSTSTFSKNSSFSFFCCSRRFFSTNENFVSDQNLFLSSSTSAPDQNAKKISYLPRKKFYKGFWWKNKNFFLPSKRSWTPLLRIPKSEQRWWMYKARFGFKTNFFGFYRRRVSFFLPNSVICRSFFKRLFSEVSSFRRFFRKCVWQRHKRGVVFKKNFYPVDKLKFIKKYVSFSKNKKKKIALKFVLLRRLKNISVSVRRRKNLKRQITQINRLSFSSRRRWVNMPLFFNAETKKIPSWPFLKNKKKKLTKSKDFLLPLKPLLFNQYKSLLALKFFKPIFNQFKFINYFEKLSDTVPNASFFRVYPQNTQLSILSNLTLVRALYQAPVYPHLAELQNRPRPGQSWQNLATVLTAAFYWRNTALVVSVLALEFRKTRYHYRFFKVFSKFLKLFLASQLFFLNIVIRVKGCFGKIARTRSLFLQPLSRFHIGLRFSNFNYQVHFSFKHVYTRRGVFSFAVWCV